MAAAAQPTTSGATGTEPAALPQLTSSQFRVYNRMAEHMDYYHNGFRESWQLMYDACKANKRPSGMSIRQFLSAGLTFCRHLHAHHSIEEQYIFPLLAKKMAAFQGDLELQHKQIHKGLDKFQEYLEDCQSGERELRLDEMKALMDKFGTVLWQHLNDEVEQLGAQNMRKYWSVEEMARMPM